MSNDAFTLWMVPEDLSRFLNEHLHKCPHATPGGALEVLPVLRWETLGTILERPGYVDVLTVSGGRMIDAHTPRSLADVRRLMSQGLSVVVRGSERHHEGLRVLAESFAAVQEGEVHVQVYATPAGTNSYGWHYDFEDVFIAQTAGVKDYYFRANTLATQTLLGEELDFTAVLREVTPLYSARLVPSDWLYLPAKWWHLVKCVEDALSVSVGIMPAAALRKAHRIPPGWTTLQAREQDAR